MPLLHRIRPIAHLLVGCNIGSLVHLCHRPPQTLQVQRRPPQSPRPVLRPPLQHHLLLLPLAYKDWYWHQLPPLPLLLHFHRYRQPAQAAYPL